MTTIPLAQLGFIPQSHADPSNAVRVPASPGSVARFEQLMYSPTTAGGANATNAALSSTAIGNSGLRQYLQQLSNRWEAGQGSLKKLTDTGQFSAKDLVLTQLQMVNCALDVEVSSKCAAMLENGVQTLVQRGS